MTTVARRTSSPFAEVVDWLGSEMPFGLKRLGLASFVPVEDFMEDNDYVVRAQLPGIDPEKDVEITIEDDILTMRGERREEKKDKNRSEFQYGSFMRSFRIPRSVQAEDVTAKYTDGVLEVRVPIKQDEQSEAHRIAVKRTE